MKMLQYKPGWQYLLEYTVLGCRDDKTINMINGLYPSLHFEKNYKRYKKDIELAGHFHPLYLAIKETIERKRQNKLIELE